MKYSETVLNTIRNNSLFSTLEFCENIVREFEGVENLLRIKYLSRQSILDVLYLCGNIQILNISSNGIGDEGCKFLCLGLRENKKISDLNLRGNNLGSLASFYVSKIMKRHYSLKSLNISNNLIQDFGVKIIVKALISKTRNLEYVELRRNLISDYAMHFISNLLKYNLVLNFLEISENFIKSSGLKLLSEGLKQNLTLGIFVLRDNLISDLGLFYLARILKFNYLNYLNLSRNHISLRGSNFIKKSLKGFHNKQKFLLDLKECYTDKFEIICELIGKNIFSYLAKLLNDY
jgi:Ran GTPase-activating protein (RanGAP) involved in mRNA processing and transport